MPDHSLTYNTYGGLYLPAQPAWFHRIKLITDALREMQPSHLDRLAVQKLFHIKERRARQLMAGLPGLQVGNAFAVSREALLARLEETAQGDVFQWETNRRSRVVEELTRAQKELAARQVQLTVSPDVRERELATLPTGINIAANLLSIRFETAEDLASKLFELSQAMANDWENFQKIAGEP